MLTTFLSENFDPNPIPSHKHNSTQKLSLISEGKMIGEKH